MKNMSGKMSVNAGRVARARGLAAALALPALLALDPPAVGAMMTITVGDTNLPAGAGTTIELLLQPTSTVSAVGATLLYEPAGLDVEFAGVNQFSLGGPTAAIHRIERRTGRIVLAAARPGGSAYTILQPEALGHFRIKRRITDPVVITVTNAFQSPAGPPSFQPITLSNIVFGIVAEDSDGDGIPDWWEFLWFGNLTTAGVGTDFDGDGVSDVDEYLGGVNPRVPYLVGEPEIGAVNRQAALRIAVRFETEPNVRYRLHTVGSLFNPFWSQVAFAVTSTGAPSHSVLVGTGDEATMYIDVTGSAPAYFRLTVLEEQLP